MNDKKTVYVFKGWNEGDANFKQERYVAAETSKEAWEKLEKYNKELKKMGFAPFVAVAEPTVEIMNIID